MRDLPDAIIHLLRHFELAFSERVCEWAKVLLIGAILAPGKRTVTAALRVMGLSNVAQFHNYHRVLNRASWSRRRLSQLLFGLLVRAFVPADEPVVLGLDDHIERRRGAKIAAKGIYRDLVRSSKSFFVKISGLRWLSMMLLAPIPWYGGSSRQVELASGTAVGITLASRSCQSAGCCCATRWASLSRKRCSAPTRALQLSKSSNGLCCAGK